MERKVFLSYFNTQSSGNEANRSRQEVDRIISLWSILFLRQIGNQRTKTNHQYSKNNKPNAIDHVISEMRVPNNVIYFLDHLQYQFQINSIHFGMFDGVIITGFLPFQGVEENPTALIISQLEKNPHPKMLALKKIDVAVKEVDQQIMDFCQIHEQNKGMKILNLHLGVSPGFNYTLEKCGYNNKDFCIPDNLGYQPQNETICQTKELDEQIFTKLDLGDISFKLSQAGHDVVISSDPGRYLCNYIFYCSLDKLCSNENCTSLFIHFPPLYRKKHEENMKFIEDFLKIML